MANLLQKASIVLTPTAYDNGKVLCAKPSEPPYGDFDFSRNSAATRVNAQGLVENVQILSSNLVQNGDFSEEGVQEVSNGSFSQEGVQLITNGDFTNNIDGWVSYGSVSTWDNGTIKTTCTSNTAWIRQNSVVTTNKYYKVTFKAKASNISQNIKIYNGSTFIDTGLSFDEVDVYQEFTYYFYTTVAQIIIGQQSVSVGDTINFDNVSVREVGQDWVLTDGCSITEQGLRIVSSGEIQDAVQNSVVTIGKYYKIQYEITEAVSGSLKIVGTFGNLDINSTVGVHTFYATAVDSTLKIRRNASPTDITITNISVKEVGQNWDILNGTITDKYNASLTSYQNGIRVNPFNYTGTVKVTFDLVVTSGSCKFVAGGSNEQIYSTSGTKEIIVTNPSRFEFNAFNLGWVGTLDNVSAIQITDDTNLPRINYEGFSYQDALGSELVVNGGFDSDTAWTKGSGWAIANGVATHTGGASYLSQSILNADTQYKVNISVTAVSGGGFVQIYMGNSPASVLISTIGDYTYYFTSQSIQTLGFALRSLGDVTIDNVSVKEYLGQEVVPDSGCGHWLWEPQSTNLVTDSEDYSQWTPTGVSVTSNSTTSPDGLINGTLLSTNGGTSSRLLRNFGLPTSATAKVLSIYAKANLSNFIQLPLSGDAQSYVNFDVLNGVVGTSGTKTTGEIQSVGNGWYRCIAYFDSTTIFGASSFVALTTSNSVGYGGIATSDDLNVYIWGSQYEEQSYATSYIPTEGSTVTRNQDLCNNGATGTGLINSTEGVLYAEIAALSDDGTTRSISLNNGTSEIRVGIVLGNSNNRIRGQVRIPGTSFDFSTFTYNFLNFNKIAISYKLNEFKMYVNGILVSTDTSGNTPIGLSELSFNLGGGASPFFGKTKALAVFPYLSDAELTELTTI